MKVRIAERGSMVECVGSNADVLSLVSLLHGRNIICVFGESGQACATWSV